MVGESGENRNSDMGASGRQGKAIEKGSRRTTIADVAAHVGHSKGTVSRALNGYPDISAPTRARVERAARFLDYSPLSQAQAIKTGIVRSIGFILQTYEHDAHRPFLASFLSAVSQAATDEGWTLTLATSDSDDGTIQTLARLVKERKADGFILPRTLTKDPRIEFLKVEGVPYVLYGRTADSSGCAWYDILGELAMEGAVLRLNRLGHRRIAFVNGGSEFYYSILRLSGYCEGLRKCGLRYDEDLVKSDALVSADGAKAAEALLVLRDPPTAFVYALDSAALGLYQVADRLGLSIGEDVSVIAYDGIPEGKLVKPPLTTYSVDRQKAGGRLAYLLIERIRGAVPESLREFESATLVERESDGIAKLDSEQLAARLREAAYLQSPQKEKTL